MKGSRMDPNRPVMKIQGVSFSFQKLKQYILLCLLSCSIIVVSCTIFFQATQSFMEKYSHLFDWKCPTAGITTFVKLKAPLLELGNGTAEGFCDVVRTEANALLLPASVYDFSDKYIRLGFGREDFQLSLKAFDNFLQKKGFAK